MSVSSVLPPQKTPSERALSRVDVLSISRCSSMGGFWLPLGKDVQVTLLQNTKTQNFRCLITKADKVLSNHFIHPESVLHVIDPSKGVLTFWVHDYAGMMDEPLLETQTKEMGSLLLPSGKEECVELVFSSGEQMDVFRRKYEECQSTMSMLHQRTVHVN